MKISRILAYRVALPLCETTYKWSGGKSVTVFDSTIVRVDRDGRHRTPRAEHAGGAPRRVNGRMAASKSPGLGIAPKLDVLGKPLVEIR